MKQKHLFTIVWIVLILATLPVFLQAQVTVADYERAEKLRDKVQPLALNVPDRAVWIEKTSRFWYRKTVKDGFEFDVVDAETLVKKPAFDHDKLAVSFIAAS